MIVKMPERNITISYKRAGIYKEVYMRHLMSPLDFSVEELDKLLDLANDIEKFPGKYAHACDGKKLATCFYEPSTRTRLSFEAAMLNLGGSVLGFSDASCSSASKGESVSDTIRIISCYADICAMRHPKEVPPIAVFAQVKTDSQLNKFMLEANPITAILIVYNPVFTMIPAKMD